MNSTIIKCVAGSGKTTEAIGFMQKNKNGLYLAFNNKIVDEVSRKGYLSKTIDSLFQSFIIPKLIGLVPLIGEGKKISYVITSDLTGYLKGIGNIKIDKDGKIYNCTKFTGICLDDSNFSVHNRETFPNSSLIKYIFGQNELRLTDEHRKELSEFLIRKYPNQIVNLLFSRFYYIIIDEAQDLKNYQEKFVELLHDSKLITFISGDDNQNINGGGDWFAKLQADEIRNKSYRCPDTNCKWIRENLNIDINGNENLTEIKIIDKADVINYDDGDRVLLYNACSGKFKEIIEKWQGEKLTIKKAKGLTIEKDVVIVGTSLNDKNLYTAITRTTKNVFSTVKCQK